MAISDTREIEGLADLDRALTALGTKLGAKALRGAAMSATLPILRRAQATIPKGQRAHKTYKGREVAPGFASRNIRRVSNLSRDKGAVFVRIGVRREAFYALQFVELGVPSRQIAARPWLVPAYNATYQQASDKLRTELEKRVRKIAAAS